MKVFQIAMVLATLRFAMAFPVDCTNVTVVHSVNTTGWPAACKGLTQDETAISAIACKAACYSDTACSVWQWQKSKQNNDGKLECWRGNEAFQCGESSPNAEDDMIEGERIMHGAVKVLNLSTTVGFYKGLAPYHEQEGTEEEKIARCKLACYTDVGCSVWQYGKKGCYVEQLPDNEKGELVTEGPLFENLVNGEIVEHYCPLYVAPAAVPEDEGLPWLAIGLGGGFGALALAAVGFVMAKKKKGNKRKVQKPQEEEEFIDEEGENYDEEGEE
jgi:hypothetical protein